MKKCFKIIKIMLILLMLSISINISMVKAENLVTNNFEPKYINVPNEITKVSGSIYNVLSTLGIIISVIILIILGMKYMLGSVEEKAEYKKTMIPYIIGAILVVAGSTIISIFQELVG